MRKYRKNNKQIGSICWLFNGAKISKINSDCLTDMEILELKEGITSRFDVEFVEDQKLKKIVIFQQNMSIP